MAINFERTFDYELVRRIITHPRIYPAISNDHSPRAEDYLPIVSDAIFYLLAKDGEEVLGLWVLAPHALDVWECHTCLLPKAYGERAKRAAREGIRWIFAHTECRRIFTNVPESNRIALRFARVAGMTEFGRHPKSFLKNGIRETQVMLGVSPEDITCQ